MNLEFLAKQSDVNCYFLREANEAFARNEYTKALEYYRLAKIAMPEMASLIDTNIQRVEKKQKNNSQSFLPQSSTTIDIVVPVYNALADVQNCLPSLAEHTDNFQVHIFVINDASEIETTEWLREFCEGKSLFTLIENPKNLGYTKSVNIGLRVSTADYVITQNSDTIVNAGWLRGMVRCMESDERIGIVGPLSNAASWQNVPELKDRLNSGFAINDLPLGFNVPDMAELVSLVSNREAPRINVVNGFCFMIHRKVVDEIGYMDEENFPVGYGEENDYCLRAKAAAFELAIADDIYVFHAKSKSFGNVARNELSTEGTKKLKEKYGEEHYTAMFNSKIIHKALESTRKGIKQAIEITLKDQIHLAKQALRILFILPVSSGTGGGVHSVVQEATEMFRLGIYTRIAVMHKHLQKVKKCYADNEDMYNIFIGFNDDDILEITKNYDVVIGTINNSMSIVKEVATAHAHILPAYYIQDYEPLFYDVNSTSRQIALESYALIPDAFLFAKTDWIRNKVKDIHNALVHKVPPSIDHSVYRPCVVRYTDKIILSAMIRPNTIRRGAARTMRILSKLHTEYGNSIEIHIFGCSDADIALHDLENNFPYKNYGVVHRPQVADILSNSDVFMDFSDYQAFGRTALEAMACGCAATVPFEGGAHEYARHKINALVLDTQNEEECFFEISLLVKHPETIKKLKLEGIKTAAKYTTQSTASSLYLQLEKAFHIWTSNNVSISSVTSTQQYKYIDILFVVPEHDRVSAVLYIKKVLACLTSDEYFKDVTYAILASKEIKNFKQYKFKAVYNFKCFGTRENELIEHCKKNDIPIYFEVDDNYLQIFYDKGQPNHITYENVNFIRMLKAAQRVYVYSQQSKVDMEKYSQCIEILPTYKELLYDLPPAPAHERTVIGYMGSLKRDHDFEFLLPCIKELLENYKDIYFEFMGYIPEELKSHSRVSYLDWNNDYDDFVHSLRQRNWTIALAPLADTLFNRSKTNIKYKEYAALGIPGIYTNIPPYSNSIKHEHSGILANNTPDAWKEGIIYLLTHQEMYEKIRQNAYIDLEKNYKYSEYVAVKKNIFSSLFNKNNNRVIYTCLLGGYDNVPEHKIVDTTWDYVLFTDDEKLILQKEIYHWTVRRHNFTQRDKTRNSRYEKINPHLVFQDYDFSFYVDADVVITDNIIFSTLEKHIQNNTKIAISLHPKRNCIYEEADVIIEQIIDHPHTVNKQMKFLRKENYPVNNGLFENKMIFRRHNDEEIISAQELWWKMVLTYSKRDQLSGVYSFWKSDITIYPLFDDNTFYSKRIFYKQPRNKNHKLVRKKQHEAQEFVKKYEKLFFKYNFLKNLVRTMLIRWHKY